MKKIRLESIFYKMKSIINLIYLENRSQSLDKSFQEVDFIIDKIIFYLEEKWFILPKENKKLLSLIKFFEEKWYIFTISPFPVKNNKYTINCIFSEILNKKEYSINNIWIKWFPKINETICVYEVNWIIPDLREAWGEIIFDWMTI